METYRLIRTFVAALTRFADAARRVLDVGVLDVEHRGLKGRTPLFDAAEEGDHERARRLLEHGADPNARRDRGDQPLHWAAGGEVVRTLLAGGADLEGEDAGGGTPLQWAARWDRVEAMRALLAAGASAAGGRLDRAGPLHEARSRAAVELLLEHGAAVDAQDAAGRSPLWHAVWQTDERQRRETVDALLEHGADPLLRDLDGVSPWHLSRQRGDAQVRRLLTRAFVSQGRSSTPRLDAEEIEQVCHDLLAVRNGVAVTTTAHPAVVQWRLGQIPTVERVLPGDYECVDDVALGPDRAIGLAFRDRSPEVRRWSTPKRRLRVRLEGDHHATAVDISPDGKWIALGVPEEVQLASAYDGRVVCRVEGGTSTVGVRFSPDGRYLASAFACQGGAHLRLDAVAERQLEPIAWPVRSGLETEPEHFVDGLGALSFSPDSSSLLVWETASCSWRGKPTGWRGNLVCFDVASQQVRWLTSIDGSVTGDPQSLREIDRELGFLAPFALDDAGRRVALGVARQLLLIDAETGACRKRLSFDHEILDVAHDAPRNRWLLATKGGGLTPLPAADAEP